MNEKFICGINEENLFQQLKLKHVNRIFVNDLTSKNFFSEGYVYVRIIRLLHSHSTSCRFVVEECSQSEGPPYLEYFDLVFNGAFSSHKICSKLFVGDRLVIEGFRVEDPFLDSKDRKIKFVLNNFDEFSSPNGPCLSLNNADKEAKLWLVANVDQVQKANSSIYTNLKNLTPRAFAYCFGVVLHFERYKSDAGWHILRLLLTDESIGFDNYVQFLIKSLNQEDTAAIKEKYQIVLFHRITISRWRDGEGISGFARIGKGGFDFLIWPDDVKKSKNQEKKTIYYEEDETTGSNLLIWYTSCIAKCPILYENLDFTISKVNFGSYETVIVQIVIVAWLSSGALLLRVWDGTKAFCPTIKVDLLQQSDVIVSRSAFLEAISKDFYVDIFVYDEHAKTGQNLAAGSYVKLKNVHAYSSDRNSKVALTMHRGGEKYGRGFEQLPYSNDLLLARRLRARLTDGYPSHLLPEHFEERFFV